MVISVSVFDHETNTVKQIPCLSWANTSPYNDPEFSSKINFTQRYGWTPGEDGPASETLQPFTTLYKDEKTGETFDGVWNRKMKSALDNQVGGDHYKNNAIQPIDFITANNLSFVIGSIIKYAVRADKKGGAEDCKKIIHYAQIELETRYKVKSEIKYEDKE